MYFCTPRASTIELARKAELDLIILDIKMPCKDGYSVFEDLKASAKTMSIPILFFSALVPELAQEKATQLGADGFVSKSADPDEILIKIIEILDKLESQPVKQKKQRASTTTSRNTG
jgi:two-component system OmpR family response regulator